MIVKRLFGPRKICLAMEYGDEIVCDSAINLSEDKKENKKMIQNYWDSYFDLSQLKMKTDEKPTLFTIKSITRRQKEYGYQFQDDSVSNKTERLNDLAQWYIRCGLIGISNYKLIEEGKEQVIDTIETETVGQYGEVLTIGWLDKINFTTFETLALFTMIQKISEPSVPLLGALNNRSGPG